MATSTFERRIVISTGEAQQKLKKILESDIPARKLSKSSFLGAERERSEKHLAQYLSHSEHQWKN